MSKGRTKAIAAGLLTIPLIFYLLTLCSTVYWGDSAEFTTVVKTMGIPHPTGYPLYCLLGKLFSLLPFGNFAWRLNLLSAVAASLAGAVLFLVIRETFDNSADWLSEAASLAAAGCFAFTDKYWSQAIISEVYALHIFLLTALLLVFFKWWNKPKKKYEYWFGLLAGLSLAHHVQSAIVIFALGTFILVRVSGKRRNLLVSIVRISGMSFLGLLFYLYLPIRSSANPPVDWGNPENWQNFLWTVTGGQFKIFMWQGISGKYDPLMYWFRAILFYAGNFWHQWYWLTILIPFGIWHLWRTRRSTFLVLLLAFILLTFHALNYQVGDLDVYFIPTYMLTAILVAHGFYFIWTVLREKASAKYFKTLVIACCLLPFAFIGLNLNDISLRGFTAVEDYGESVLRQIQEPAIIVTHSDNDIYALWYQKYVAERATDTIIAGSNFVSSPWYSQMLAQQGIHAQLSAEIPESHSEWSQIVWNKLIRPVQYERNIYFTQQLSWSRLNLFWSKGYIPGITYDPLLILTMVPAGLYEDRKTVSVDPEMVPQDYVRYLPPSTISKFVPTNEFSANTLKNLHLGVWASSEANQ